MMKDFLSQKPFSVVESNHGWYEIHNKFGQTIDLSGDGGFEEETAKKIIEILNNHISLLSNLVSTENKLTKDQKEIVNRQLNYLVLQYEYDFYIENDWYIIINDFHDELAESFDGGFFEETAFELIDIFNNYELLNEIMLKNK